jgi:hypothetical protein
LATPTSSVGVSSVENSELKSTFNGVGPRFGSDAEVNLGEGFSVRGRLGLSALIGSRNVDANAVITAYNADGTTVAGYITGDQETVSQTRLVPELDGRLGLNYTVDFDSSMALGFEAGWQAVNYFNAISGSDTDDVNTSANFALQGPYARIQFDVA